MEFFPLVALGVSSACVGTLLILIVALFLRSRFCHSHPPGSSPILRSNGTNSGANCEKNLHGGGLMSPSLTATTNNSDLAGYRQIPQSKSEADANPDIIPGANNFSTDYEERNQWTLGRKGIGVFLSSSGDPYSSHHHPSPSALEGPGSNNITSPYTGGSTLERRDRDGRNLMSSPSSSAATTYATSVHYNHHSHHPPHQKTSAEYTGGGYPATVPPSDYNTIYIRDKLFHDSDIPESCV